MLARLRTGLGFRVAIATAMFAALCFVVPPAAMAFGHGANMVQCLTHADMMDHGMQGSGHQDQGDHAKIPGDKGCCGLFCLSAIAPASGHLLEVLFVAHRLLPPALPHPVNRAPERIDRPPISLLSA